MALALGSRMAWAAEPLGEGVRIDQMQPASAESAFFYAEGPHQPFSEGVEFGAGVTFEYGKGLLYQVSDAAQGTPESPIKLVEHAVFARISGSITPLHWLSFDMSIPFALFERGERAKGDGGPPPVAPFGVGDLRAGVHFRPLDTRALGLILGGRFWAPLGSKQTYLSDGRFRVEVDAGVAGEGSRLLYGCSFSVAPGLAVRRNGDRAAAACALHGKLSPVVSIGLEPAVSLISLTEANNKHVFNAFVEPLAALRLRFGGFRIGVAAGPGFGQVAGAAQVRGLVNFAYVGQGKPPAPPAVAASDRDLDQIADKLDACPDEAGAASDDPRQRGCPVRDRDADGIPDAQDGCPDRAGVRYASAQANGCPDADNDNLPDPIDGCRIEPGSPPDGCPRYARLTGGGFEVRPPITFSKKDDKLSPEGHVAIEEIAATMRANPKLDRISIEIGTKGGKPKVSEKYAQQILLILRGGNLDTSRYEVMLRADRPAGTVVVRLVQ